MTNVHIFFDKANIDSKNKYSLRTNTFEPRTIFYTLIHIMLDVLKRDSSASFFFIGAEDERDVSEMVSRRFRVYRRFVSSVISDEEFEHYRRNDLSLYMLINKHSVKDTSGFAHKCNCSVKSAIADSNKLCTFAARPIAH